MVEHLSVIGRFSADIVFGSRHFFVRIRRATCFYVWKRGITNTMSGLMSNLENFRIGMSRLGW